MTKIHLQNVYNNKNNRKCYKCGENVDIDLDIIFPEMAFHWICAMDYAGCDPEEANMYYDDMEREDYL